MKRFLNKKNPKIKKILLHLKVGLLLTKRVLKINFKGSFGKS